MSQDKQKRLAEIEAIWATGSLLSIEDTEWLQQELKAAWAREAWKPISQVPETYRPIFLYTASGHMYLGHRRNDVYVAFYGENLEHRQQLDNVILWKNTPEDPGLSQQEGGG